MSGRWWYLVTAPPVAFSMASILLGDGWRCPQNHRNTACSVTSTPRSFNRTRKAAAVILVLAAYCDRFMAPIIANKLFDSQIQI